MPLRLVTGAANAGKTGEVLGNALAAAAAGASPVVVVPRLSDVRRLEVELSRKAPLGVRVSTLSQLVLDLWLRFGDGRRIVGDYARNALLRQVVARDSSQRLAAVAGTPGFSTLLARLARESSMQSVAGTAPGIPRLVNRLLDGYRDALLQAGLIEKSWAVEMLAAAKPQLEGPVCLMRFDAFRPRELLLLSALAESNEVTVGLTWEAALAPTSANDEAAMLLGGLAEERIDLEEREDESELHALARALFSGPVGMRSAGKVTTGLACGLEAESALATRFVCEAIEEGTPPERIVLAFPDPQRRIDSLRAALRAEGIPAQFDVAVRLDATRFGQSYLGLLALAAGVGGRAEAMTYLASPFSGASSEAAHEMDRTWRENRVSESDSQLRSLGGLGGSTRRAAVAARAACRAQVSGESSQLWKEVADSLLLASVAGAEGRAPEIRKTDAAAHKAVSDALVEVAAVSGLPFTAGDALAMLPSILVYGPSQEIDGFVQVTDFASVGARRFDVVVLGGLNEEEISIATRESLFDELRSGIGAPGGPAWGDLARLQFYSLVTRAREQLILIRQETDSQGRALRASALWDQALDAYRAPRALTNDGRAWEPVRRRITCADIEESAPAMTLGRREMRKEAQGLSFRTVEWDAVVSAQGLGALSSRRTFSPTEIETYLGCPYRWFYERVVVPEDIDRELDARELGSHAHNLMASFYRLLAERGPWPRVDPENLQDALSIFEKMAQATRTRSTRPVSISDELALARSTAWARSILIQDASFLPGFIPKHAETSFPDERPFKFAGVEFRGRIDRIDVSETNAFVTDYKSSRNVTPLAKFASEGKVQTVVYALAAEQLLDLPVSGSVYRSMSSGKVSGYWRRDLLGDAVPNGMCEKDALDEVAFAELAEQTERRVAEAIEGMRAGRIERSAAVKGACTYCAISAMCKGGRP